MSISRTAFSIRAWSTGAEAAFEGRLWLSSFFDVTGFFRLLFPGLYSFPAIIIELSDFFDYCSALVFGP